MRTTIRTVLAGSVLCALSMPACAAVLLPAPDLAKLALEDGKASGQPYRYGIAIPLPREHRSGRWEQRADGRMQLVWELASPGARTLDLHFERLSLPAGSELILRGEDKTDVQRIAASAIRGGAGFWTPYVHGETIRAEIVVDGLQAARVDAELADATHGYRGLFEAGSDLDKSGSCNVDVACPAGANWGDQIDAVGHYTFSENGSSYVCTGTLMANTAQTTTPYFLTANHCVDNGTVAASVVVYWNYQTAVCRTPGSVASGQPTSRSTATHNQSGTTLVATHAASDFALLQLNNTVPAGADAFHSGWDASGATPTSAAGIHHPAGHEKRIAIDADALQVTGYGGGTGTTHWRVVDWNEGTTEGGSSGSGLWNQNRLLVGQLHGGSAACGNELSDYYGRLSVSWTGGGTAATRLRDWLDPNNTGATSVTGYRTGGGSTPGNQSPVANFSFGVNGLTANFTDASTDADGTIAQRSWAFGDGGTSTATSPSRAYALPGTYTVDLIVTDNLGATGATSQAVTLTGTLIDGQTVADFAGASGSERRWTLVVPAGATNLRITTTGGTGDADLYLRAAAAPTTSTYDCRSYSNGNAESCTVATPAAGVWHVLVHAYSAYGALSLTVDYDASANVVFYHGFE